MRESLVAADRVPQCSRNNADAGIAHRTRTEPRIVSATTVPPAETGYHAPFLSIMPTIAMDGDLF
jgi:hypothetical protein